jgi:predicted TIM-barrel fold metal-dependent hydrolase
MDDVALSGGGAAMAALTELARPERIVYGSDWPFVEREFVIDQLDEHHSAVRRRRFLRHGERQRAAPVQAFRLSLS